MCRRKRHHDPCDNGRGCKRDARLQRERPQIATRRCIWPLAIGYFSDTAVVGGWCELRGAFRHFRTDRIRAVEPLEERFEGRNGGLMRDYMRAIEPRQAA